MFIPKGWRPRFYTADSRSGSLGKVLQTLVGQPVSLGLPSPRLLCLDYTTLLVACQELFLNQAHFYPAASSGQGHGGRSYRLSWVSPFLSGCLPLAFCAFIITDLLGNVKYFFSGFSVPKQSRSSESYSVMSSPENISQSSWNSLRSEQENDAPLRISQIPASPSRYQTASAVSA